MLSNTAGKILQVLLHQENDYITVKRIACMIEVSERSVNTYLKEVSDFCRENDYELIKKRGSGVKINCKSRKEELLLEISKMDVSSETRKGRIDYIIRMLILNQEVYTISQFADELYVSRGTITSDIAKANEDLKGYGLKIITITGHGIKIVGDELSQRNVLVHKNQSYENKMELQKEIPDYRMTMMEYSRMCHHYKKKYVDGVIECIQMLEHELGKDFNDYSYNMLVEYISNQIVRVKQGCMLNDNVMDRLTLVEDVAEWVVRFVQLIDEKMNVFLDPREALYLYILFVGSELQSGSGIVNKKFLIDKEINIEQIAGQVIRYISTIVGKNFNEDVLLRTSMSLFLNCSLIRVKFGLEIKNPFLEDVKRLYPAIFSACFAASQEFEDLVGRLPIEDEISYMSLLFGGAMTEKKDIVNTLIIGCGGVGIAQIMARKIEEKIPEINVVSILAASAIDTIEKGQYDLMITTMSKLQKESQLDFIFTTPIVDDQDLCRIRKACKEIEEKKNETKKNETTISEFISKDYIFMETENVTKEQILEKVCKKLYEDGYVKKGFHEDVRRRERISSSALGDGVAIPHGMANMVNAPVVAIVKLSSPIEWDGVYVDVIFLLALNFKEIQQTRAFFGAFYEMTVERDSANQIRMAQTKEEIIKIVS